MISLDNSNNDTKGDRREKSKKGTAMIEYARDETHTNERIQQNQLESSAASEWPDFTGAATKSPTRGPDDLFSMLLMENNEQGSSPPLQESGSSGQSSDGSSRPPVGSRSYSRELLSMFLDQATSNEEEALTYAMKQPELSPRSRHQNDFTASSKKKSSTRKKKRDGSHVIQHRDDAIPEDDWSDWRETNKAIDSMLKSPVPSLSTGDTTPRSNNVAAPAARAPLSPSTYNVSSPHSYARSLGPQDAVSVYSDLTGFTGSISDNVSSSKSMEMEQQKEKLRLLAIQQKKEERELDAIAEKARILSTGPTLRQPPKPKKTVRFDYVEVRNYQRILSCNPSCTSGPPVGLGWAYNAAHSHDINRFETFRGPQRRTHRQLIMPRPAREDLLRDLGYSEKDLAKAVRQSIKTKNQRKQTVNNLGASKMEERIENAGRKVKSLFGGGD